MSSWSPTRKRNVKFVKEKKKKINLFSIVFFFFVRRLFFFYLRISFSSFFSFSGIFSQRKQIWIKYKMKKFRRTQLSFGVVVSFGFFLFCFLFVLFFGSIVLFCLVFFRFSSWTNTKKDSRAYDVIYTIYTFTTKSFNFEIGGTVATHTHWHYYNVIRNK